MPQKVSAAKREIFRSEKIKFGAHIPDAL